MNAEEYTERYEEIDSWRVHIVTYRLGSQYFCSVDNVDPGARFARAEGTTRDQAEQIALAKARRYLAQTRRFPTTG